MSSCSLRFLALLSLVSCASTTMDAEDRSALATEPTHEWRPATEADIAGLYASEQITGPMAAALWKLYYHFDPSGNYTGAALFAEDPPRFGVLSGTWTFDEGRLQLDDGEAAETLADDNAIQLSGQAGTVILRRERES